jgi:membrane-associated phospholipid phosphatase
VALVLFVAGWLAYRRRWRELSCFAVIAIGGTLLSEWVKEFVSRPRPSALSFSDYGNSFPSGHVTSAATIFVAAYYFLGKPCAEAQAVEKSTWCSTTARLKLWFCTTVGAIIESLWSATG